LPYPINIAFKTYKVSGKGISLKSLNLFFGCSIYISTWYVVEQYLFLFFVYIYAEFTIYDY
jgi:hypothetical protein